MTIRAIILSGGRSSRFGGAHKPAVELGGITVISRILSAVRAAAPLAEVWVAGPTDGLSEAETESVVSVREEPAFAGPLAGIAAACGAMQRGEDAGVAVAIAPTAPVAEAPAVVTLVLAGDMPLITANHLGELIKVCRETGAPASGRDDRGKTQYLCTAWPMVRLISRLEAIGDPRNGAVKLLFEGLEATPVDVDATVLADFDTTEDLARIRTHFGQSR